MPFRPRPLFRALIPAAAVLSVVGAAVAETRPLAPSAGSAAPAAPKPAPPAGNAAPAASKPSAPPAGSAAPAAPKPEGPKALGVFDDWIAAWHQEAGQTICYAFTHVQSSTPEVKKRGRVVLTVTQRSVLRDSVALEAGFAYPSDAMVAMKADATPIEFYTAQRNAFARDGHAAVTAMTRASKAVAVSSGPKRDDKVTDTFSLKGFTAAYAAIGKKCPAKPN